MTKNKKHKKTKKPMALAMHSAKTGGYILIALVVFLIGGSIFLYLAWNENQKFEIELQTFLSLTCKEMKRDISIDKINGFDVNWKDHAYTVKLQAGGC